MRRKADKWKSWQTDGDALALAAEGGQKVRVIERAKVKDNKNAKPCKK